MADDNSKDKEKDLGSLIIDPSVEDDQNSPSAPNISPKQEQKFYDQGRTEFLLRSNRQNLGHLGAFFGANAAPNNIAGLLVVFCVLFYGISFFSSSPEMPEARKVMIGLMTTCLGFLFGAASKSKEEK